MISLVLLSALVASPWPILPGATEKDLERVLSSGGFAAVERIEADAPQGMRRGMIESGLLSLLNRFSALPKDSTGSLDPKAFVRFVRARRGEDCFVFVLGQKPAVVSLVLLERAVPVDRSVERSNRAYLAAFDRALAELRGFDLVPFATQADIFAWRGRGPGVQVLATYQPKADLFSTVLLLDGPR